MPTPDHGQLLAAALGVLASVVALLGLVLRSYLRRIEGHVNHVEEDICPGGDQPGKMTLGQRVKQISDNVDSMARDLGIHILHEDVKLDRIWDKLEKLPPRWLLERIDRLEEECDKPKEVKK